MGRLRISSSRSSGSSIPARVSVLPGSRAHDDRIQLQIVGGKQQERAFHFLQTFICIVESQFRP